MEVKSIVSKKTTLKSPKEGVKSVRSKVVACQSVIKWSNQVAMALRSWSWFVANARRPPRLCVVRMVGCLAESITAVLGCR